MHAANFIFSFIIIKRFGVKGNPLLAIVFFLPIPCYPTLLLLLGNRKCATEKYFPVTATDLNGRKFSHVKAGPTLDFQIKK